MCVDIAQCILQEVSGGKGHIIYENSQVFLFDLAL